MRSISSFGHLEDACEVTIVFKRLDHGKNVPESYFFLSLFTFLLPASLMRFVLSLPATSCVQRCQDENKIITILISRRCLTNSRGDNIFLNKLHKSNLKITYSELDEAWTRGKCIVCT
jgi:hypothetical protein